MPQKVSITKSIERAFEILECFLDDNTELSMMDIISITGLPLSTAHRILATLENSYYLDRNPETKKYYLGTKIAQLGMISITNLQKNSRKIALPYLYELKDIFNESVTLFSAYGKYRVCIERVEPDRALKRVINIGERLSIDRGASGKLLLAYMPEEDVKKIVENYNQEFASKLKKIKKQGYSISIGERDEGLGAISAPIFDASGKVFTALSVAGPKDRILNDDLDKKIEIVIESCKNISKALGYRGK